MRACRPWLFRPGRCRLRGIVLKTEAKVAGGIVTGVSVVLEIQALGGRSRLAGRDVQALMTV